MLAKTKFKPFAVLACVVLVLLAVFCIGNVDADAAIYSGNCGAEGDNVKWSLDTETGTLTISGTGEMGGTYYSGDPWDEYRLSIKKIVIEDQVTSVSSHAFNYLDNLTEVVIGNGIERIHESAFTDCDSLKTFVIGDSLELIYSYVFNYCESLENFVVSENNTNYKAVDGVLYSKDGTVLVRYPIGKSDIEYVILDGVTTIGEEAFENSVNLEKITIPDSVKEIGMYAFEGCYNLSDITIGDGIEKIGYYAFNGVGCGIWENGCCYLDKYLVGIEEEGLSGPFVIKEGTRVIADGVFNWYDNYNITAIFFPDSLVGVGEQYWDYEDNFPYLVTIGIGAEMTDIGFLNSIDTVAYISVSEKSNFYKSIDGVLFSKDGKTLVRYPQGRLEKSYIVPAAVTKIGGSAFSDCDYLENIVFHDNIETIEKYAFDESGFYNNKDNWENGILYVGDILVTVDNSELSEEVIIKDGTTHINDYTFMYSDMTSVVIPDSVVSIGEYNAFVSCDNLTKVVIGSGLKDLCVWAFTRCPALEEFVVSEDNPYYTAIDGVLYSKDGKTFVKYTYGKGVKDVVIPEGVTKIGHGAFFNCSSFNSITLPSTLVEICDGAFYNNGYYHIAEFTVPASVKVIGRFALVGLCDNIEFEDPEGWYICDQEYDANRRLLDPEEFDCESVYDKPYNKYSQYYFKKVAVIDSGYCGGEGDGTNLTYTLYEDGVLVIEGEGKMKDYYSYGPWFSDYVTRVYVGHGVTSIGDYALYGETQLEEIIIPDTVTSIGSAAFMYCYKLVNIDFPEGLESIRHWAFNDSGLITVVIPEKVTYIGPGAFDSITTAIFKDTEGWAEVNGDTFINLVTQLDDPEKAAESLRNANYDLKKDDGTTQAEGFCGEYDGDNVKWSLDGFGVLTISGSGRMDNFEYAPWYDYASEIYAVVIEDGVCSIGFGAFNGCYNLNSVIIPDSVTEIETWAFIGCSSLTEITLPKELKYIGDEIFVWCDNLTSVIFSNPDYWRATTDYETYVEFSYEMLSDPETAAEYLKVTYKDYEWSYTHEHDYSYYWYGAMILEPTCSEKGIMEYTCYTCGATRTEEIEIDEDAHAWSEKGILVTAPTCVSNGSAYYACCNDDRHFVIRDDVAIDPDAHNFVDGKCANGCGTLEYCAEFENASLSAGKDLTIKYYINVLNQFAQADISKLSLSFTMNGKTVSVAVDEDKIDANGNLVFDFTNIAPQCIGDTIKAEVVYDGVVYETKEYSVKQYLDKLVELYKDDAEMVQMVVDMLEYSAAAQKYTGHKTDNLVNTNNYGKPSDVKPSASDVKTVLNTSAAASESNVRILGATVRFDYINKIGLKISGYENARLIVNGVEVEVTGEMYYTDGIHATDFDKVYSFELYDGDILIQTFTYSVNSYIYSQMNKKENGELTAMAELARALYRYGESAKKYEKTHS